MTNVLRRPIHPEQGNATMALAAKLAMLYSYGTTNGAPWLTDCSALTYIQGEPLQIPWHTRAEADPNKPSATGGFVDLRKKVGLGIDEGDHSLDGGTEGDDISLTSEFNQLMQNGEPLTALTSLRLTMKVYEYDPRVASKAEGAKNAYPVDVGTALRNFDSDKKSHGTEIAFRNLFGGPCATFKLPLDATVAFVKAKVFSAADVERKWEELPGVK